LDGLVGDLQIKLKEDEDLNGKYRELEALNREFRSQIYAKGMSQNPKYTDDYYTTKLGELRISIENRLVGLVEDHSDRGLSGTRTADIFYRIEKMGPHGQQTCRSLKADPKFSLAALYHDDRLRGLFVRHVVALFLLHRIFEPFAFGIYPKISDLLQSIENNAKIRSIGGC
jgi:hypothetical protein